MSSGGVVGFVGNFARPSKSRALVEHVVALASERYGLAGGVFEVADLGPSLGQARRADDLDGAARAILETVVGADLLVVGTPTYKGSYTGLFKHVFDLVGPQDLMGKPVILTATGGGDRHALLVEHQLRPLFAFFQAHTLPTAVYAADRDFTDYRLTAPPVLARVGQAISELAPFFGRASAAPALAVAGE